MTLNTTRFTVLVVVVLMTVTASASAAVTTHAYRGADLAITWTADGEKCSGTIERGGKSFPFSGTRRGDALTGAFTAGGTDFPFTMTIAEPVAGTATLVSGKSRYDLRAVPQDRVANVPVAGVPAVPVAGGGERKLPVHTLVLQPRALRDPMTNMDVVKLLLPKDWKLEPQITWQMNKSMFVVNRSRVVSPDGRVVLQNIPADVFLSSPQMLQMARQNGTPLDASGSELVAQPMDVRQYITEVALPRHRKLPGMKIVAYTDMPKVAEEIVKALAPVLAQGKQMGIEYRYAAGKLRIEYVQDGVAMEEDVYCTLMFNWSPQTAIMMQQAGFGGQQQVNFIPERLYSFSAPKGKLDEATPLLQVITASARTTPEWDALIVSLQQIRQKGAMDRARIMREAQQEIGEMQRQAWREQQASNDRIHRRFGDYIRGIDRYVDPADPARQVELPSGYRQAWSDGNGSYIISNDQWFNPNQDQQLKGNWQEMKPAKD